MKNLKHVKARLPYRCITLFLTAVICLSMVACSEGNDANGNNESQASASLSLQIPTQSDTPTDSNEPQQSVIPETTPDPVPATYRINGISYPGNLGEPLLGASAAELANTATTSTAALSINNVGDAIYYMQALPKMDQPFDTCTLFTELVGGDYDEVGMIYLSRPDNAYVVAYILQDGIYYPLDLFSWVSNQTSWIDGTTYSSGTDLNLLCEKLMTTCPYNLNRAPMTEWESDVIATRQPEAVKDFIIYLSTPQYTKEQIDSWVSEDLSLEQWAEKIKVPADAIQALNALGYRSMLYQDNVVFYANDVCWGGVWNAQTVFDYRSGNCGGTSHIMNALLSGDFDEQGYIGYNGANGGHIFNYFVSDGIYAFCDFVDLFTGERHYIYNSHIVYTGYDINEFADEYMNSRGHHDPNHTEYIYHLFMYPRDGVALPKGNDWNSEPTKFGNVVWDVLPAQYKNEYTFLYTREGYPIRFKDISPTDTWPAHIQ